MVNISATLPEEIEPASSQGVAQPLALTFNPSVRETDTPLVLNHEGKVSL